MNLAETEVLVKKMFAENLCTYHFAIEGQRLIETGRGPARGDIYDLKSITQHGFDRIVKVELVQPVGVQLAYSKRDVGVSGRPASAIIVIDDAKTQLRYWVSGELGFWNAPSAVQMGMLLAGVNDLSAVSEVAQFISKTVVFLCRK